MIIRSRAPMVLNFCGEGTHERKFYEKHGGATLSAAIKTYAYTSWNKDINGKDNHNIPIINEIIGIINNFTEMRIDPDSCLDVVSEIQLWQNSNAASSLIASIIGAIWSGTDNGVESPLNIAQTRYRISKIVRSITNQSDVYTSIFGGFNLIQYKKDGNIHVSRLKVSKNFIAELQSRIVFFYSPNERRKAFLKEIKRDDKSLIKMKNNVFKVKEALEKEDINSFASLIEFDLNEFDYDDPFVSKLYDVATKNGAIGFKIHDLGFMYFILKSPYDAVGLSKSLAELSMQSDILFYGRQALFDYDGLYTWRA